MKTYSPHFYQQEPLRPKINTQQLTSAFDEWFFNSDHSIEIFGQPDHVAVDPVDYTTLLLFLHCSIISRMIPLCFLLESWNQAFGRNGRLIQLRQSGLNFLISVVFVDLWFLLLIVIEFPWKPGPIKVYCYSHTLDWLLIWHWLIKSYWHSCWCWSWCWGKRWP